MSGTVILCYSFTGKTRRAAKAVAAALGAELAELECSAYRPGFWGFMKAAGASLTGALPEVRTRGADPLSADHLILAGPIWIGRPATPLRAWLKAQPALPEKLSVLFTQGGRTAPESAYRMIEELAGQPLLHRAGMPENDAKGPQVETAAAKLAETLRGT